jgi:hypothetical protein
MNDSNTALHEYFAALRRLQEGKPLRVPKGCKITNDSVSLEAGRSKGSIKKSRALYADLIRAIEEAARSEKDLSHDPGKKLLKSMDAAKSYRLAYEAALGREVSLLAELLELKKKLASLTGEKVIPLRKKKAGR